MIDDAIGELADEIGVTAACKAMAGHARAAGRPRRHQVALASRPHVSNDNPYSEAQFKTMKYRPDFPAQFASIEHARRHTRNFMGWHTTPIAIPASQ